MSSDDPPDARPLSWQACSHRRAVIANEPPAAAVTNSTVCLVAVRNVAEAAGRGSESGRVMSAINPEDVDKECDAEHEILLALGFPRPH